MDGAPAFAWLARDRMPFSKHWTAWTRRARQGRGRESLGLFGGCANSFVGRHPDPRERDSRLKSGIDTSPLNQRNGIEKAFKPPRDIFSSG